MRIFNDNRVDRTIRKLPYTDQSQIVGSIQLLRDYGFSLSALYLKKLIKDIWELRSGRYRLLFGMIKEKVIIVNIFFKKSQKTPKNEIELAVKRLKIYEKQI
ncbi:hypothetical protein COY13_00335 [Candidatus Roizmanbacteria bacterium CG_4_10_14_0_2_um_filter_36_35]|uniref:Type II toxin-antitoxin system RelE/ParE family toxin n=1 Tax=Candidatus Roizmanbacteria bacterium CG_4_10_14_0_2_um_filter_36_35 TaxID=1974822 RepID=A0A2M7UCB3_9BACT|nr:MAG: hypothetical protein COY13_00335 [Candidatus Roizmanbacteria bacterium CG_4_10_14_0_2_um_filter_36_35]